MASFDVVVPCYQHGHFLRGCVASVLSQQVCDVRVLILDNASTDSTLEVARRLAAEDDRVYVVSHQANLGHLASYNEGIDWACSDYFMVLCADDLLAPGCFARAAWILDEHPEVNLTFGRESIIEADDPMPVIDELPSDVRWQISSGPGILERICGTGRPG